MPLPPVTATRTVLARVISDRDPQRLACGRRSTAARRSPGGRGRAERGRKAAADAACRLGGGRDVVFDVAAAVARPSRSCWSPARRRRPRRRSARAAVRLGSGVAPRRVRSSWRGPRSLLQSWGWVVMRIVVPERRRPSRRISAGEATPATTSLATDLHADPPGGHRWIVPGARGSAALIVVVLVAAVAAGVALAGARRRRRLAGVDARRLGGPDRRSLGIGRVRRDREPGLRRRSICSASRSSTRRRPGRP